MIPGPWSEQQVPAHQDNKLRGPQRCTQQGAHCCTHRCARSASGSGQHGPNMSPRFLLVALKKRHPPVRRRRAPGCSSGVGCMASSWAVILDSSVPPLPRSPASALDTSVRTPSRNCSRNAALPAVPWGTWAAAGQANPAVAYPAGHTLQGIPRRACPAGHTPQGILLRAYPAGHTPQGLSHRA